MMRKFISFNFFFFFFFLLNDSSLALNAPSPKARPEIKVFAYNDVFDQIKKQNWPMAIALADDYQNPALSSYIRWLDITRPGSNHSFAYLKKFYKKHSHWPKIEKIIEKIEQSINDNINSNQIIEWFKISPPTTSKGKIMLMEATLKDKNINEKKEKIRDIWINSNLTYRQQKYFIKKYSRFWTEKDNWQRFNRLIYEGKNLSARRTLNRISGDYRRLGEARLGLSRRVGNVSSLIKNVPTYLQNDPGLIYERMRWRRKAKLDSAAELLINPPDKIENVRNWWINSRIVIRRLINKKKFAKAYEILKNHNLPLNEKSGLEAEWLAGWVAYLHLKNYDHAVKHLENVFNNSDNNFRSKSAYWLALSHIKKKSDRNIINKYLEESSKNKFSFYGQNSALKLGIFNLPSEKKNLQKPSNYDDLINVINILSQSGQKTKKTYPFFEKLFLLSSIDQEKYYVLNKANSITDKSIVSKLSKKLIIPSAEFSYPEVNEFIPKKFKNSKSTIALIHAIIHQESNFSINAYSSAGARGLMQLMPFTAKKVARDLKIKYYKKKLTTNPQYNILLGTTYINEMLIKFNNSLPLALAAYNAGPGRVKIWIKRYGDPRQKQISYENWIESIPISETRFYVQKVLSNLRIYQKKYNLNLYKSL